MKLSRCSLTLRNPTTCEWASSFTNQNVRWISHSYPRHESAEKKSSSSRTHFAPATSNHQPPLPVRIALVSTTTALATPAFPALGFLYLVLRVTVPDANMRKIMEGRWGVFLSFTTFTLLPNLYHGTVASLILPCAISNAIVAGGVYGLVDMATGGPSSSSESLKKALQTPWITGSGIGISVGYVAPNHLYGPVMEHLYGLDGMSQSVHYIMGLPYATEVSVVTGAVAGMLLHPLLYYPTHGIPSLGHWGYFSGAALAAATSALLYVYYGREETGLPVPYGSLIEPSKIDLIDSILRYNNISGNVETYSLNKQQFIGSPDVCLEGQRIAEASRSFIGSGKVVFDERWLAFVYNYWDANTRKRYPDHIVNIKPKRDLQLQQNSMALTDASVAVVLHSERNATAKTGRDMMKTLAIINGLNEGRKLPLKRLEDFASAIELLMTMKQLKQDQQPFDVQVSTLETFIHRRCPELTLYTSDEEYENESVESQLRMSNWKGPESSQAMDRWKKVQEKETYQTWKNRALFVATGVLLSIAGSMLQGSR